MIVASLEMEIAACEVIYFYYVYGVMEMDCDVVASGNVTSILILIWTYPGVEANVISSWIDDLVILNALDCDCENACQAIYLAAFVLS